MKIGVNALFLRPGEVGGSETYLLETIDALLRIDPALTLVLFTAKEGYAPLFARFGNHPRVAFEPLSCRAAHRAERILQEQLRLPGAARRRALDVLWSPGYTGPLFPPCPHVLTILDMQYKRYPDSLKFSHRLASDLLIQTGARRASRLLAISEFSRQEILRFTGARAERVAVTPLAVSADFSRPGDAGTCGIAPPYLLCVAHTHPHKNVAALCRAYAELQGTIPHALVLVGQPRRGEAAVSEALRRVRNGQRVHRLESVERSRLIRLYQQADLFVFPSLYEGFGLPVLEAMAAGTPVLTTRCGSLPELGGDAVLYFDPDQPDDLVRRLRESLTCRDEARIAQARQRAGTFTWEQTARRTLDALHRAARESR